MNASKSCLRINCSRPCKMLFQHQTLALMRDLAKGLVALIPIIVYSPIVNLLTMSS